MSIAAATWPRHRNPRGSLRLLPAVYLSRAARFVSDWLGTRGKESRAPSLHKDHKGDWIHRTTWSICNLFLKYRFWTIFLIPLQTLIYMSASESPSSQLTCKVSLKSKLWNRVMMIYDSSPKFHMQKCQSTPTCKKRFRLIHTQLEHTGASHAKPASAAVGVLRGDGWWSPLFMDVKI